MSVDDTTGTRPGSLPSVMPRDDAGKLEPTEIQDKPATAELDFEFGVDSELPFSIPYIDGSSVEVLREQGEEQGPSVRQLVAMRRTDGQARALYRLITLPIRSALKNSTFVAAEQPETSKKTSDTKPDDKPTAKEDSSPTKAEKPAKGDGEAEREFIEQMFTLPSSAGGMTIPFSRVVSQLLMATFDGFSAFEQVYQQPQTGPLKGKYTLRKLAHRPPETITFLADKHGGFAGLRQRTSFQGRTIDVAIEAENAIYYACQEEERKFYGVSLFQSAFYHYDKKVKLYYVAHLAAQRAAVGTRKGVMPQNASTANKNRFLRALADLGVAQYIALPGPDWDVENLKEGGTFDFLSYINHHNSQMSKSVLAAFFDDNQGGGSADTSLVNFGQQSDAMFLLMLQSIMEEIAGIINDHLIPKFIDWNFGSALYPQFQWGTFTDEQKTAIRETFTSLATVSQPSVTPDFMFELEKKFAEEIGLDLDYTELQKEFEDKKAQEKEAADTAHQRTLDPTSDPNWVDPYNPPPVPPPGSGGGGTPKPGAPKPSGGGAGDTKKVKASNAQDDPLMELANQLLERAAEESAEPDPFVELHGQKGEKGYALLHSPNSRVRAMANKEYNKARDEGKSAIEAQKGISQTKARAAAHDKSGGGKTLVTETGEKRTVSSGSGDSVASGQEAQQGGAEDAKALGSPTAPTAAKLPKMPSEVEAGVYKKPGGKAFIKVSPDGTATYTNSRGEVSPIKEGQAAKKIAQSKFSLDKSTEKPASSALAKVVAKATPAKAAWVANLNSAPVGSVLSTTGPAKYSKLEDGTWAKTTDSSYIRTSEQFTYNPSWSLKEPGKASYRVGTPPAEKTAVEKITSAKEKPRVNTAGTGSGNKPAGSAGQASGGQGAVSSGSDKLDAGGRPGGGSETTPEPVVEEAPKPRTKPKPVVDKRLIELINKDLDDSSYDSLKEVKTKVNAALADVKMPGLTVSMEDGGPYTNSSGKSVYQLEMNIRADDGELVGHFERHVYRNDVGDLEVEHHLFKLDPDQQGKGIASQINRRMEELYAQWEIKAITLHANIDVGGYAWAKAGYDWDTTSEDKVETLRDSIGDMLFELGPQDPQVLAWGQSLDGPVKDWPLPYDLAMYGYKDGLTTWPGKKVMLGKKWLGRKEL